MADPEFPLPEVFVHADAAYAAGCPMVVAVTLRSTSDSVTTYNLPDASLVYTAGRLGARLTAVTGDAAWEAGVDPHEPSPVFTLHPREERRMLLDLSNLFGAIPPGDYRFIASIRVAGDVGAAPEVPIRVVALPPDVAADAERLRRLSSTRGDGWANFLRDNRNTVSLDTTRWPGYAAPIAHHLFLHWAYYGPVPIAWLDPAPYVQLPGVVWPCEAALWQYEVFVARGADAAVLADHARALNERWPGCQHRLEAIHRGEGALTRGRALYGAGRREPGALRSPPYVGAPDGAHHE